MSQVDLSNYTPGAYNPGPLVARVIWYVVSLLFFENGLPFPSSLKRVFLRIFGATIGKAVVLKPRVRIKYPWFLTIGDYAWIGEEAWLDNIAVINIGAHACVSQGAYLCTGNHDYTRTTFDLKPGPISLERGAWVGARAVVCPGVTLGDHAVASAGSVVTKSIDSNAIVAGNPARLVRMRSVS